MNIWRWVLLADVESWQSIELKVERWMGLGDEGIWRDGVFDNFV